MVEAHTAALQSAMVEVLDVFPSKQCQGVRIAQIKRVLKKSIKMTIIILLNY